MSFIDNVNKLAGALPEGGFVSYENRLGDLENKEEFTTTEKSKLQNIQGEATKNQTDAHLLERENHTGTQTLETITETATKKIFTKAERDKLAIIDPETPPAHQHNMGSISGLAEEFAGKSDKTHNHDTKYYPRSEADTLFSQKSNTGHSHDDRYFTELEINNLLSNYATILNTYTKVEITNFLAGKESSNMKGVAGGYAPLDSNGLIPSSMMNSLSTVEVFEANSQANMLLLSGVGIGDQCVRSDLSTNNVYLLKQTPASDINNWIRLSFSATVASVNGMAGVVVLTKSDIGLSNVQNIAPLDMPLSNVNITALAGKSNTNHTHTTFSEEQEAIINQKANQSEVESLTLAIQQTYILNLIGA